MDRFVPDSPEWEVLKVFSPEDQARLLQSDSWVYDHAHSIDREANRLICSTRGRVDLKLATDFLVASYDNPPVELIGLDRVLARESIDMSHHPERIFLQKKNPTR